MSNQQLGKRWWWMWVLMLSVGINIGVLAGWLASKTQGERSSAVVEQAEGDPAGASAGNSSDPADRVAGDLRRSDLGIAPRRLERIVNRMADELGLKDDRRDTFLEIQRDFFHRSVEGRDRLRTARAGLRRELTSPSPERGRAEHWVGEVGQSQSELEQAFIANYFATRELLDPEQDRKFRRFMARIHKLRRQLMEQGEGPEERFRRRSRRGRPRG